MARKKEYPGGFRLTLATARKLAVQEFGTAKGLEPDRGTYLEGFFTMRMGNMGISISPDADAYLRVQRAGHRTGPAEAPADHHGQRRGVCGNPHGGTDLWAGRGYAALAGDTGAAESLLRI